MNNKFRGIFGALAGLVGLAASPLAQSALLDRGNGLIYDDVQNLTWVQDVSLGSLLTWDEAMTWADGLDYGGFSDWRLPGANHELPSLLNNYLAVDFPFPHLEPGPFTNFDTQGTGPIFWLGADQDANFAYSYNFQDGFRAGLKNGEFTAWAVRSGDVGPGQQANVPVPAAVWLFGSALAGFGVVGRKKPAKA